MQPGVARGRSSKCNKSAKMPPLELPAWDVQCSASRYTLTFHKTCFPIRFFIRTMDRASHFFAEKFSSELAIVSPLFKFSPRATQSVVPDVELEETLGGKSAKLFPTPTSDLFLKAC